MIIEKGIPIPDSKTGSNVGLAGLLRRMEIGDSVYLQDRTVRVGAYNVRLAPKRFTARYSDRGVRIWRIE